MKNTLLLLILLFSLPLSAQQTSKTSTFHRLLIFNEKNELMVVRFKDSDRWVTPGWYQDEKLTIRQGLDQLAATFGVKISSPILKGVFTLKDEQDLVSSTRLVYSTKIESGKPIAPESIGEIKWLTVPEATKVITFPHISSQIMQITRHPKVVWGGTQRMYKDGNTNKSQIVEDYYPLFETIK